MKLGLEKIREITAGAARVEEENGEFHFYRFTSEQEKLYKPRVDFYFKTFSTSGIKFCFKTDSKKIYIKGSVSRGCARSYYAFELFVNGECIGVLDNFSNQDFAKIYPTGDFPLGSFDKEWKLDDGEKKVTLYFPWSVNAVISDFCLDDGCFVDSIKPERKLLCFGDSITHGYDAPYPTQKYTTMLAERLNAEEFNKGIGGEVFFSPIAATKENFIPDLITVAYGTNDWNRRDRKSFIDNCQWFYKNLSTIYPDSPIYSISPIWRKDLNDQKKFGSFFDVESVMKDAVSKYPNVKFVRGLELFPHSEDYMGDRRLHPNEKGFEVYADNLLKLIK